MRLFNVWPSALPTALLSRQHQTTHLLLSAMASGRELGGMTRFSRCAGFVAWVHFTCVEEMYLRGMSHESPINPVWSMIPVKNRQIGVYIPPTRYMRDQRDLALRIGSADKRGRMDDARISVDVGIRKFAAELAVAAARGLPASAFTL